MPNFLGWMFFLAVASMLISGVPAWAHGSDLVGHSSISAGRVGASARSVEHIRSSFVGCAIHGGLPPAARMLVTTAPNVRSIATTAPRPRRWPTSRLRRGQCDHVAFFCPEDASR